MTQRWLTADGQGVVYQSTRWFIHLRWGRKLARPPTWAHRLWMSPWVLLYWFRAWP